MCRLAPSEPHACGRPWVLARGAENGPSVIVTTDRAAAVEHHAKTTSRMTY